MIDHTKGKTTEPTFRLCFSVTVDAEIGTRALSRTDWARIAKRLERAARGRSKRLTVSVTGQARHLS